MIGVPILEALVDADTTSLTNGSRMDKLFPVRIVQYLNSVIPFWMIMPPIPCRLPIQSVKQPANTITLRQAIGAPGEPIEEAPELGRYWTLDLGNDEGIGNKMH